MPCGSGKSPWLICASLKSQRNDRWMKTVGAAWHRLLETEKYHHRMNKASRRTEAAHDSAGIRKAIFWDVVIKSWIKVERRFPPRKLNRPLKSKPHRPDTQTHQPSRYVWFLLIIKIHGKSPGKSVTMWQNATIFHYLKREAPWWRWRWPICKTETRFCSKIKKEKNRNRWAE